MRNIAIYGAGGFGRETALMIDQINLREATWNLLGFFDDGKTVGSQVNRLPVFGGIADLNAFDGELDLVITVSDPLVRREIRSKINNRGISFPALIHPSVIMGDLKSESMLEGVVITAGNILTTNVHIQSFSIINLACTIGHDVAIGDYCSIMPGCSISGSVTIESGVLIGAGARILPGLSIGAGSKVGAGAVVTNDVAALATVVGVPARVVGSRNE